MLLDMDEYYLCYQYSLGWPCFMAIAHIVTVGYTGHMSHVAWMQWSCHVLLKAAVRVISWALVMYCFGMLTYAHMTRIINTGYALSVLYTACSYASLSKDYSSSMLIWLTCLFCSLWVQPAKVAPLVIKERILLYIITACCNTC